MGLTQENLREKKFHDDLQSKKKGRFENIFYKAIYNSSEDFFRLIELNAKDSNILDYGCGIGLSLEKVVKFKPKKINGIDISEVSINKARNKIINENDKINLSVDNCEKTQFNDNQFDLIYGSGILHHLEFSKCLGEIKRILKPGGTLIFIEPLGTNPIINLYRMLTPKSRSKDEHPLVSSDFKEIEKNFNKVRIKYYGFLTLVFFPFYKSPEKSLIFSILKSLDQFLFKIGIFKKLAWSVLISAKKI